MTQVLQNNKNASKKPNDTFFTIETTYDKTTLDLDAFDNTQNRVAMTLRILQRFKQNESLVATICDGDIDQIKDKLLGLGGEQLEFKFKPKFDDCKLTWDIRRYKGKGSREKTIKLTDTALSSRDDKEKNTLNLYNIVEIVIGKGNDTLNENSRQKSVVMTNL